MIVTYFLFLLLRLCDSHKLLLQEDNNRLTTCVKNIILQWCEKGSDVTYVDLNYNDNDIIKEIHTTNFITVISRTTNMKVNSENKAYIVTIDNFSTFRNQFMYLTRDESWKPDAYFIIVFKEYEPKKLTELFDTLLRLHIFDVAVMYAMNNSIYTYNPFQNKSCGKTFQEIIHYDNCSQTNVANLHFSEKEKELTGCTFNVATSNWPPFALDPKKDNIVKLSGLEQYLMQIVSELEGFSLNYTFIESVEQYPIIYDNMTATGSLALIQKGDVDIMFGGMFLIAKRTYAFSYVHGYIDYDDEIKILVKKAGPVPAWKNIYLEFTYPVWILLLLTFIGYFVILSILFRLKDKCYLILVMWGLIFQYSHRLRLNFKVECFLFQWVIFAFLISTYYQSNLTGLTTRVSSDYQISSSKDIDFFKIQPCINSPFENFIKAVIEKEWWNETNKDCDSLLDSITTISKDNTKFTFVMHSVYKYHEFKYKDEFGKSLLYLFPTPESKIIYATYFYKGFPKVREMHKYATRIRETGLLDKHYKDIQHEIDKKYFAKKDYEARFILPWHVLVIGYGLSTVAFVIELVADYIKRKRMNGLIYLE